MPLDLNRLFLAEGHDLNFFQAAHLLERLYPGRSRPGTGDALVSEPVRYETLNSMGFPPSDVSSVFPPMSLREQSVLNAEGKEPPRPDPAALPPLARLPDKGPLRMTLSFMGLYGVSSPLPAYFIDPITLRKVEYFELRKFLDIFSHRIYSLFYRAWKKYRHHAQFDPAIPDAYTTRLLALTGQWPRKPGWDATQADLRRIPYGRFLGNRVRSAKGLEQLLRGYFGFPRVRIVQFAPSWVDIPAKTRLGDPGIALGRSTRMGERMRECLSRFTVEIGPLDRPRFELFGKPELPERVRTLIDAYLRDPLEYDIRVLLEPEPDRPPVLGSRHARMGMGLWLGEKPAGELACNV